uniref:Uncharacterized protein n=1 Tax=Riptortus pedestris TaxID=329032 RepID=R4WQX9_RIPPE|nr:conserved hypothetical protein [Riptortus pedestris]
MRVYHRNTAIFAGIFTLLQGVIWAFLAVYSVGIYACTFDYPYYNSNENTVGNIFFYSYLQGSCRLDPTKPIPIMNPPHRTYAIMLTYGIVSAVWIPSALLVLIIAVNRIRGKTGARCYYPWILTTGTLLILDIVATIIYAIDINHTMTPQDYRNYFPYVTIGQSRGLEGLTVVPAVIMTTLFCRGIIIWLLNLVVFFVLIQAMIDLKKPSPTAQFVESEARMKPERLESQSNWVRVVRKPPEVPERQMELPPRPRVLRLEEISGERLRRSGSSRGLDIDRDRDVIQSPSEERERPILKPLVLAPPSQPPPPPPTSSPIFDVYGKPTTPDSPQPVFVRPVANNQHQDGGVNKDMPWSYVNPQKLPPLPRPLPEPDYTLHRVRKPTRSTTPSDDGDYRPPPPKRYENNPNVWKVM